MMLFPSNGFSFDGSADFSETQYSYLSRSNRPEMQKERELLQCWFDNYPDSEKEEISSRIKSNDDSLFDSVFYEMFLHAVLTRLGCKIEVHPSTESDDNCTPDFLLTASNGEQFYLEAKVGTDKSKEEVSRERLLSKLLDFIREFPSPNFYISVIVHEPPVEAIPQNLVKQFIEKLIRDVDPNELKDQLLSGKQINEINNPIFACGGTKIEFRLLPKCESRCIKGNSSLGPMISPLRAGDSSQRMLNAMKKKASKYKKLNLPYVIALNASMWGITPEEMNETLFGWSGFFPGKNSLEAIQAGRCKSHYTRVSSIWFSKRLSLDTVCDAQICQYDNPWAERPLRTDFKEFGRASLTDSGNMDYSEGQSLGALLGLPDRWPE